MNGRTVRIGSASGFWGDTAAAAAQLVRGGDIRYLVFDYLAEGTMSIMAGQRVKDPGAGFATDFVQVTMKSLLPELKQRGIRVVANAGGVNPTACRDALAQVADSLGVPLRIGVVLGDDLAGRADALRTDGVREMYSGEPFPSQLASVNAYLGALPIARALDSGCDVVIPGRCVDSAVTLGVLIHEFGWSADDYDRLAQGTLAGHLVECGAQCTGGLFTDWDSVPRWDEMGFPVIEADADGGFVVTKPPGTGGLVTPATVAEQMLYEIGDPRAYLVPDVSCDFTRVRFEQAGPDRVRVSGAIGRPPTDTYKVSATFVDGFRNAAFLVIGGERAAAKARRTGEALMARLGRMLAERRLAPLTETRLEVLGDDDMFGPPRRADAREVVLKLAVRSSSKASCDLFAREFAPAATSMAPGTTGLGGGRPSASPVIRLFSFLIPKREVPITLAIDGQSTIVEVPVQGGFDPAALGPATCIEPGPPVDPAAARKVPLITLAYDNLAKCYAQVLLALDVPVPASFEV